jgi:hypothetical protein
MFTSEQRARFVLGSYVYVAVGVSVNALMYQLLTRVDYACP